MELSLIGEKPSRLKHLLIPQYPHQPPEPQPRFRTLSEAKEVMLRFYLEDWKQLLR